MSSFRKRFTLKRKAAGTTVDGIFTEGAVTTSDIYASAQPFKPEDVQQFDFGRRNAKFMSLITSTKLQLVTSANPDMVVIDNEDYNVEKEEVWGNGILPHYKYLVVKEIE